jgi:hypothetical protein
VSAGCEPEKKFPKNPIKGEQRRKMVQNPAKSTWAFKCIARWKTRYIRYTVVHQHLNPLQIGYTPVTSVTSFLTNNLGGNIHQLSAGTPPTFGL